MNGAHCEIERVIFCVSIRTGSLSAPDILSILLSNIGFWPSTVVALLLVCCLSLHPFVQLIFCVVSSGKKEKSSIFDKAILYLGEKQDMLVNDEWSSL